VPRSQKSKTKRPANVQYLFKIRCDTQLYHCRFDIVVKPNTYILFNGKSEIFKFLLRDKLCMNGTPIKSGRQQRSFADLIAYFLRAKAAHWARCWVSVATATIAAPLCLADS
jgi:hypothetical protein